MSSFQSPEGMGTTRRLQLNRRQRHTVATTGSGSWQEGLKGASVQGVTALQTAFSGKGLPPSIFHMGCNKLRQPFVGSPSAARHNAKVVRRIFRPKCRHTGLRPSPRCRSAAFVITRPSFTTPHIFASAHRPLVTALSPNATHCPSEFYRPPSFLPEASSLIFIQSARQDDTSDSSGLQIGQLSPH